VLDIKQDKSIIVLLLLAFLGYTPVVDASEGNWKKGRIYYRMVCSECHAEQVGHKISPSEKTKAEWADYFDQNIHGKKSDSPRNTVSFYLSKEYRESIKDSNRAAAKMLKVPEDQLREDVKAFLMHTAKDSDQPSRCE
jgi:hypothetical protein